MSVVSAIPANLTGYGAATIEMDSRLNQQGSRLQSAIEALNRSAPDPSVLGPLPSLGSQVSAYASGNATVDAWVGDVGQAFENANTGGGGSTTVVTTQQSTIDGLVKGEEPQGAKVRGVQLMKATSDGKNGLLDLLPSGHASMAWLLANKWWMTKVWGATVKGGQVPTILASMLKGYRLVRSTDGKYIIAKGSRFLTDDSTFFERYLQSGRVAGTRYLATNGSVAKYFDFKALLKADLTKGLNPMSSEFWKAAPKAGGAAAMGLTLAGDVYNYGWGSNKKDGFGNKFVGAVVTDGATTAGTIAITDTATSLATGALVGSEIGSVVPGLGTVVGLGVGVGVSYFMTTKWGKDLRSDAINGVADGLHYAESGVSTGYHAVANVVTHPAQDLKTVGHDLNPLNW